MFLDNVSNDSIWISRESFKDFLVENTNMLQALLKFFSSPYLSSYFRTYFPSTELVVADIGCGSGWASDLFSSLYPVSTLYYVDLPPSPIYPDFFHSLFKDELSSTVRRYKCGSFQSLPFSSQSVDVLIYNASLHHTSDLLSLFTEAFRVLSTNGILLITNEHLICELSFMLLYLKKLIRETLFFFRFSPYPQAVSSSYILYDGKLDDRYYRLSHVANCLSYLSKPFTVFNSNIFPYINKPTPFPFTHLAVNNHE